MKKRHGVKFINKKSCYIERGVTFGKNVVVYPGNIILGNTHIGSGTILEPYNYIKDSQIGSNNQIGYSHLVGAKVGNENSIGPYSRIRPNSIISSGCKIGNFVEIKNSSINSGTKASHHAYIGDSVVGKNCNIGCGVIFANYNGKEKNKIEVKDNCFIGSNCNLIAPLLIEQNTYIAAGTTVVNSTSDGDFVIGRARQENKKEKAKKYLKTII